MPLKHEDSVDHGIHRDSAARSVRHMLAVQQHNAYTLVGIDWLFLDHATPVYCAPPCSYLPCQPKEFVPGVLKTVDNDLGDPLHEFVTKRGLLTT